MNQVLCWLYRVLRGRADGEHPRIAVLGVVFSEGNTLVPSPPSTSGRRNRQRQALLRRLHGLSYPPSSQLAARSPWCWCWCRRWGLVKEKRSTSRRLASAIAQRATSNEQHHQRDNTYQISSRALSNPSTTWRRACQSAGAGPAIPGEAVSESKVIQPPPQSHHPDRVVREDHYLSRLLAPPPVLLHVASEGNPKQ